jgi:hypothetical protein
MYVGAARCGSPESGHVLPARASAATEITIAEKSEERKKQTLAFTGVT